MLRRPHTSAELGEALGVDERTARRVLEALKQTLPEVGKGIGYEVNPNAAGVGRPVRRFRIVG